MQAFLDIITEGEFDHYGIRAHRGAATVGETLGSSRVWIDGECTDDELRGISTIKVRSADEVETIVARLRREYCWDSETIVLVGGYEGEWGEDDGEYIIRDNICLATL